LSGRSGANLRRLAPWRRILQGRWELSLERDRRSVGMAKKASAKKSSGRAKSEKSSGGPKASDSSSSSTGAGEAFINLLQSPLVAELIAVAATAALAALAEQGFASRGGGERRGKRAGKAVKQAGKAAAAAVGRRLSVEIDEIKSAAKAAKGGAEA
jgi:hypothetical protein